MPEQEGEIYDVVERFRRTLLQRERHAASKMVRVYGEIWQRIKREYDDLKKELFETEGENKDVLAWKLMRAGKLKQFIENELARFSVYADESIVEQQREAIEAAEAHAQELILKSLGEVPHGITIDLYQPNRSAVEKMVGMTQPDSPLHRLLAGIAPQAAEAAGNVLVQGIILGKNPYDVAVDLRKVLGEALSRALRIARTEVLRAYREATRETYRANADVVKGWIWHSACDDHTCVACWVMHGTHHSLDERLDDHPNGRCSALPLTKSWEEIGKQYGIDLSDVPDTNPDVKQGVLLFNRLSRDMRIKILGPAKYAAWLDGKFSLVDLVGRKHSKEWGTHRYEKSLAELGINARSYLIAPKRHVFGYTVKEVQKLAKEIDARIGEIIGGEQRWSGKIFIKSKSFMPDAWGTKEWNCDIWLRDDCDVHTLIHELLHGRSAGLNPKAYEIKRAFEEATVEGLARIIGAKVYSGYTGHHGSYQEYVDIFEEIRRRAGLTEMDFYVTLIKTNLSDRFHFMLDLFPKRPDLHKAVDILSPLLGK